MTTILYLVSQTLAQSVAPLLLFGSCFPVALALAALGTLQQVAVAAGMLTLSTMEERFSQLGLMVLPDDMAGVLIFTFSLSNLVGVVGTLLVVWLYDKQLGIGLFDALLLAVWSATLGACVNASLVAAKLR